MSDPHPDMSTQEREGELFFFIFCSFFLKQRMRPRGQKRTICSNGISCTSSCRAKTIDC